MEFKKRLITAFALLILFAVISIGLQIYAEGETMSATGETAPSPLAQSVINLTAADFLYGPQAWRPYAVPLSLNTLPETTEDHEWYLCFVLLNDTPYGGNPALFKRQVISVNYTFENLAGTAAFYLYGSTILPPTSRTSRQEGYGSSGYIVTGNAPAGDAMPQAAPLERVNLVSVRVANTRGLGPDDIAAGTIELWFPNEGSGQDALHITTNPEYRKGEIVADAPSSGRFYVTHTGGSRLGLICLLVAVDRPQPEDFSLRLETHPVEAT